MWYVECPSCGYTFEPTNVTQIYCSDSCKKKAAKKREKKDIPIGVCASCGINFEPVIVSQIYCSQKCKDREKDRRYKKSHPSNSMTLPFRAWDGEGENGKYTLLANSDGKYIESRQGLSTERCLNFLVENGADNYHINVWFAFGYDVSMILKDIPLHSVYPDEPTLEKLHRLGKLSWKGFDITYFPGKKFFVRRGKRTFVSYDTYSFFQKKFTTTTQEWLGEIAEIIQRGKEERENFANWPIEDIVAYNSEECRELIAVMHKFRESLKSANLSLTSWHGPGAIASIWLKNNNIKVHMAPMPEAMQENVLRAYFGGRIEIAAWGHAERVYHYDINSAYPRALCDCISLAGLDWRLTPGAPEKPFTLCHVKWDIKALHSPGPYQWGPLPYRMYNGSILFSPKGEGWYWGVEALAAQRRFPNEVEIIEHWEPVGNIVYPFRVPVMRDAAQRLAWKKQKFAGHVPLKLALNSLYGKLAQKKGFWENGKYSPPPYQCHAWAGYVTAFCRAMINDALAMADGKVVCVMTDSVWSLVPLDLKIGEGLGEWEYAEEDVSADFAGAGLYQAYDSSGNIRDKEYKSRGFSIEQGGKLDYREIIRGWESSLTNGDWGAKPFTIRRFIGIGQAVRQKKYQPYFGHFIEIERKLENLAFWGQSKRVGFIGTGFIDIYKDGLHWLMPMPVPKGNELPIFREEMALSAPFKVGDFDKSDDPEIADEMGYREDE